MSDDSNNDSRAALERLLLAQLEEQRRNRRWGLLFKSLFFIWLFLVLMVLAMRDDGEFNPAARHTALIEIQGEIGGEDGVMADNVITALKAAYEDKHTQGIVLRVNSPGGSPVHSGQIYDEIRRLRALHPDIPVHAVVDDICASGGYFIAAAADKIFVDKASIIGSIGVVMDGFGFTETMKKLGVERRLLTAGENKGFLDPFSPVNVQQVEHARGLLEDVHRQFIQAVRQGRGKRLKETPEIFSGLVWSGARGIELGLADGLGNLDYVAREIIKAEDVVDFTPQENLVDRLARRIGTSLGESMRPWAKESLRVH